jgi:hypothetical protein
MYTHIVAFLSLMKTRWRRRLFGLLSITLTREQQVGLPRFEVRQNPSSSQPQSHTVSIFEQSVRIEGPSFRMHCVLASGL